MPDRKRRRTVGRGCRVFKNGTGSTLLFIESHLGEDLDLAALARTAGVSPYHFCRAFRRVTGMPPMRYVWSRRVAIAKTLLAASDAPVGEIAMRCGFASASHFSTVFRRHAGASPRAWRRAHAHERGTPPTCCCAGVWCLAERIVN